MSDTYSVFYSPEAKNDFLMQLSQDNTLAKSYWVFISCSQSCIAALPHRPA